MIRKFSVRNFKNFKEEVEIDFTKVRDYNFNQYLIKNSLINKMLIYGKNNSGKSNLGAAMMDITRHLTDNQKENILYLNYINGDSIEEYVDFKYEFLFDGKVVKYNYKKNSASLLLYEELLVDDEKWFAFNYETGKFENNIE
ncbi:MAG: AAA family ATPase, partial [Bacilli bacterium]|nr:AAA family ATPase [Bacilli bacterium]